MGTCVYRYPFHVSSSGSKTPIAHADSNGVIYNHPYSNYSSYAVGHVDSAGVVYNDPYLNLSCYAIGHIDKSGIIYDDPYNEYRRAVGHVSTDGCIYNDPQTRVGCLIGTFEGNPVEAAAIALLFMKDHLKQSESFGNQGIPNNSKKSISGILAEIDSDFFCAALKLKRMLRQHTQVNKALKSDELTEKNGEFFRWYSCPKCKNRMLVEFSTGVGLVDCTQCKSTLRIYMAAHRKDESIEVLPNNTK